MCLNYTSLDYPLRRRGGNRQGLSFLLTKYSQLIQCVLVCVPVLKLYFRRTKGMEEDGEKLAKNFRHSL